MRLLLTLLLFTGAAAAAAAAAASEETPYESQPDSWALRLAKREFDLRRLFSTVVDYVKAGELGPNDEFFDVKTLSIDLYPSEAEPDFYDFVLKRVMETMQCRPGALAVDWTREAEDKTKFSVEIDQFTAATITKFNTSDSARAENRMLRRIGEAAGIPAEQVAEVGLDECWYFGESADLPYLTKMMRININVKEGLGAGWVLERHPLGTFYRDSYQYPIFLSNYSFIDAETGMIVDVAWDLRRFGDSLMKRVWTPTGKPAFARVATQIVPIDEKTYDDFALVRETEAGALIATLNRRLKLTYPTGEENKMNQETVALRRHHYHVTCDRKKASTFATPLELLSHRVIIMIGGQAHRCPPKAITESGRPRIMQLDEMDVEGSAPVPESDRAASVYSPWPRADVRADVGEDADATTREPERTTASDAAMSDVEKKHKDNGVLLAVIVIFVLFKVTLLLYCKKMGCGRIERDVEKKNCDLEKANSEKKGHARKPSLSALKADALQQKMKLIDDKIDEEEEEEEEAEVTVPAPAPVFTIEDPSSGAEELRTEDPITGKPSLV